MTDLDLRRRGGRPPKLHRAFGCSLSLQDFADVAGLSKACIKKRLDQGSSLEDALIYRGAEFPEGAWEARGTAT